MITPFAAPSLAESIAAARMRSMPKPDGVPPQQPQEPTQQQSAPAEQTVGPVLQLAKPLRQPSQDWADRQKLPQAAAGSTRAGAKGLGGITRFGSGAYTGMQTKAPINARIPKKNPALQQTQAPRQTMPQQQQPYDSYLYPDADPNVMDEQRFAKGGAVEAPEVDDEGVVRGPDGVDKVPATIDGGEKAKLSKGEFVFSKKAVALYGIDTLKAMLAAAEGKGDAAEDKAESETEANEGDGDDEPQKFEKGGVVRRKRGNGQGEATWFRAAAEQGAFDQRRGRFTKGPFAGMSLTEAQDHAPVLWQQMAQNDPNYAETWDSRANGRTTERRGVKQLPRSLRRLPNAPDLSRPAQRDPVNGTLVRSGASPYAAGTFQAMNNALTMRKATAKQAVADKRAQQVLDVPGTVDRAIAAKNQQLAQDGITDLGGGEKSLSNKYGTGYATTSATPRKFGSKPGAIMDENGVVDLNKTRAANTVINTPGSSGNTALNMDARDAVRADIGQKVNAAMPGAADRLAADRNREIARVQGNVNRALVKTAGEQIVPAAKEAIAQAPKALPAVLPALAGAVTGSPIATALTNAAFQFMPR